MKKSVIAILLTTVILSGCSDTPEEIKFEQEKELLRMKMQHEQSMASIEARKVAAANPVSHTYVENEYETEYHHQAPQVVQQEVYSATGGDTRSIPEQQATSSDSGLGIGSLALAAATGYAINEVLSNGHRTATTSDGRTIYLDSKGNEVSKNAYDTQRKSSPVLTKARDLNTKSKEQLGKTGATLSAKSATIKEKLKTSTVGKATQKGYTKAKEATKATVAKAKPVVKSAYSSSKNAVKPKKR